MRRARKRTKQTLDILHYITSVGWVGVGFCQLTLNIVALTAHEPSLRHAAHEVTHIFDRALLIALGSGSLVTGVLLGLKTKWGLVQYWWVLVKLGLTIVALIFSGVWMGGWIGRAIALTARPVAGAAYGAVRTELFIGSVSTLAALLFMTVISVLKPWGRTWRGHRARAVVNCAVRARPAALRRT